MWMPVEWDGVGLGGRDGAGVGWDQGRVGWRCGVDGEGGRDFRSPPPPHTFTCTQLYLHTAPRPRSSTFTHLYLVGPPLHTSTPHRPSTPTRLHPHAPPPPRTSTRSHMCLHTHPPSRISHGRSPASAKIMACPSAPTGHLSTCRASSPT